MTTRELTVGEYALLRAEGQRSEIYLGFWDPETVFACQVNQTFETHDQIAQVVYDNVTSGSYTDILAGMSLYIGSAAGLYDLGILRIRKSATSSIVYFGETSEIDWAEDLYLTVVDEIGLWVKHPLITDDADGEKTTFIDFDIPYGDQHADMDPVPVLGPIFTPLTLVSGTVDYSPPDASASWVLGSTISSYLWSATGGSVINETTSTPTFTFTTAGQYRLSCLITAANGKTFIGHRAVKVFDDNNPPVTAFELKSCEGSGPGWQFSAFVHEGASVIRDRSMVVLFAKDFYDDGTVQQSIGASDGNEQIISCGWVAEESILIDPVHGYVSFRVLGSGPQLNAIAAFPVSLLNSASTPASWEEFEDLTIDKALFHLLHWQTTATAMMDVTLTEDTRLAPSLGAMAGSLMAQINTIAGEKILASARSDRYSALWIQIDQQYLAEADRVSIPVVMDITSQDWFNAVTITRILKDRASMMEISGEAFDGSSLEIISSRANGNILTPHGAISVRDGLIFSDQDEANIISSLMVNRENNEYPLTRLGMSSNQRMSDIAPVQYVAISILASENEAGVVCTNKKLIPRKISLRYNAKAGDLQPSFDLEAETLEGLSVTYERPQTPEDNFPPLPDFDPLDFPLVPLGGGGSFGDPPGDIPQDPEIPEDDDCPTDLAALANGPWNLWMKGTLTSTMRPASLYGYMRAVMRIGTATYPTSYLINAQFQERIAGGPWVESTDADWYTVYPIDANGNRLTAGTKDAIVSQDQRTGVFNPPAAAVIGSVEFNITSESDSGAAFTTPVQSGPPALAWTYDGVSEAEIIPFEGGYRMVMQSTFTCVTLTPVSGTAGGTAITTIFLGPIVGTSYLEVEARMSVLSAPANYSDATIRNAGLGVASDDITVHALTYSNDNFYATASGSNTGLWSFFSFAYPDGVVAVGTYVFEIVITVKRAATKRVLMDSAFLYNLCPRPSTE